MINQWSMLISYIYSIKILQVFQKTARGTQGFWFFRARDSPDPEGSLQRHSFSRLILKTTIDLPHAGWESGGWSKSCLSKFFGGDIYLNKNKKKLKNNCSSLKFTVGQGDLIHVDSWVVFFTFSEPRFSGLLAVPGWGLVFLVPRLSKKVGPMVMTFVERHVCYVGLSLRLFACINLRINFFPFAEGELITWWSLVFFKMQLRLPSRGRPERETGIERAGISWRVGALKDVAVYTHALMAMKGSRVFVFLLLDISQQHHNSRKKLKKKAKDQNPS